MCFFICNLTIMLHGKDILSINDLTKEEIECILDMTTTLKAHPEPNLFEGLVMASCFFEPSTRTRLSFENAFVKMGGSVTGFADPAVTSVKKGETLYDSMRIIGQYVDVVVVRHRLEGAARRAADATDVPVMNGGDGANQHPTQTLLDLFTIRECQGRIDNLSIALVGDLKYGRTVHSLAEALVHYDITLHFVAPESLQMPAYICDKLDRAGVSYTKHSHLEGLVPSLDILYMTRIQEERFPDKDEYERLKNSFIITPKTLSEAKSTMKILHPLPRVNEIDHRVDKMPHAHYFEQARNGLYTRQAVMSLVLGKY